MDKAEVAQEVAQEVDEVDQIVADVADDKRNCEQGEFLVWEVAD